MKEGTLKTVLLTKVGHVEVNPVVEADQIKGQGRTMNVSDGPSNTGSSDGGITLRDMRKGGRSSGLQPEAGM